MRKLNKYGDPELSEYDKKYIKIWGGGVGIEKFYVGMCLMGTPASGRMLDLIDSEVDLHKFLIEAKKETIPYEKEETTVKT